jgi:uracil phosphoribosyltransferase
LLHEITILDQKHSLLNHFMAELRDLKIQKDAARFRKNLERIGEVMAYEISRTLPYHDVQIQTPFGQYQSSLLKEQPVLITIIRAGIPFFQGILNYFDQAQSGFIGAQRSEPESGNKTADTTDVHLGYDVVPDINDKTIILVDPMLATGNSLVASILLLLENWRPQKILIATVIAAPEGIQLLKSKLPRDFHLWTVSLDKGLDERAFIYPGLGDAGDLAFGEKIRRP